MFDLDTINFACLCFTAGIHFPEWMWPNTSYHYRQDVQKRGQKLAIQWCRHPVLLKPYSTQFNLLLKWLVSDDIIILFSNCEQSVRVIRLNDTMYEPMRAEWSDRQDVLNIRLWAQENNHQMLTTTQFRNVICMIFSVVLLQRSTLDVSKIRYVSVFLVIWGSIYGNRSLKKNIMDNLLRLRNHALNPVEPEYLLAGKCVHGARGSGSQRSASSSTLSSCYEGTASR